MNLVIVLFVCLIGIGLLFSISLLSKEVNQQKSKSRKFKNYSSNYQKSKSLFSPKVVHLQKKLLMIAGDKKVTERLIKQLRYKYPDETEAWYWEKAIYDLERDRYY
ncbi:hypothetical protein [Chroococcus sp. FPU101]|uniref:hypothetical protein n=1 Tax=Chroococcus sp. FPU101 TaxID=1974212 RepID=UPI001A8F713B|nr:hypothetical protein [Chroococcus sp. FPU101]GFE72172.1 hypothetical protein CFPU101_47820 [Chroococcus sp. FPU101]